MRAWVGFSPPCACATDIANSASEAEVIAAMAALRMFNIFYSPLDVIVAPGRDRAAVSIFRRLPQRRLDKGAIYSAPQKSFSMVENRKAQRAGQRATFP
jgi:hypothetical protein